MLRATPADLLGRRLGPALVAVALAASALVVGPSAPRAQALGFDPCNLPGGKYVCKKALDGLVWADKNVPGFHDSVGNVNGVVQTATSVADFASDPFGYVEEKLSGGTKSMFQAFGEQLTGKKVAAPKKSKGN